MIPANYCRCLDSTCPRSQTCARYIERNGGNERTQHAQTMRESDGTDCGHFIPETVFRTVTGADFGRSIKWARGTSNGVNKQIREAVR